MDDRPRAGCQRHHPPRETETAGRDAWCPVEDGTGVHMIQYTVFHAQASLVRVQRIEDEAETRNERRQQQGQGCFGTVHETKRTPPGVWEVERRSWKEENEMKNDGTGAGARIRCAKWLKDWEVEDGTGRTAVMRQTTTPTGRGRRVEVK